MNFTDDEIEIIPGHCARTWQSCNYRVRGQNLFHERTFARMRPTRSRKEMTPAEVHWLSGGPAENSEQWFPGRGTEAEIEVIAKQHGGFVHEEFYPADDDQPLYFLAFDDTSKALAFCRSRDFDRLCLTLEKVR